MFLQFTRRYGEYKALRAEVEEQFRAQGHQVPKVKVRHVAGGTRTVSAWQEPVKGNSWLRCEKCREHAVIRPDFTTRGLALRQTCTPQTQPSD